MKRLFLFFAGLVLMVLMCGALFLAGGIYDTAKNIAVETYFFQSNDSYLQRPGVPVSVEDLGPDRILNMLIAKYITEFFYVTPDVNQLERRKGLVTGLGQMSAPAARRKWESEILPEIESLTNAKALRTVTLIDVVKKDGEKYWEVVYELKTWNKPNNFSVVPEVVRGVLYMDIFYEPNKMRKEIGKQSRLQYLKDGNDPASVFRFGVLDIVVPE